MELVLDNWVGSEYAKEGEGRGSSHRAAKACGLIAKREK